MLPIASHLMTNCNAENEKLNERFNAEC